ncbi:ATP-binding cassette domain-containing protein [Paenibacillus yanchengensis]|uniref:ATP-binding cassette domain-containing protein n=1 Tax=Paenibacillus yanchengensis TaxID=2035833 RepID=A0ABW4YM52_9BACL
MNINKNKQTDIILHQVTIAHPNQTIENNLLHQCNQRFEAGHIIVITGNNGAGKSTLLETIAGLKQLANGEIIISNQSLWTTTQHRPKTIKLNRPAIIRLGLAMQQVEQQWFAETVKKELLYALKPYASQEQQVEERIHRALTRTGLEEHLLQRDPWTLSRGQQRRLALSCIAVTEPDWILLDEPLSGLDHRGKAMLIDFLQKYQAEGVGAIVVTHDLDVLQPIANKILTLHEGSLADDTVTKNVASETVIETASRINNIMQMSNISSLNKKKLLEQTIGIDRMQETDKLTECEQTKELNDADNRKKSESKFTSASYFDPRSIIVSYLLLSTVILLQEKWSTLIITTIVTLLLLWPIRTLAFKHISIIKVMFFISIIFTAVSAIQFQPLSFDWSSAAITGQRLYKLLLVMTLGLPMMSLITPFRLKRAFEQTFGWLSKYKVPVAAIGLLITLIFRFIPLLIEEWQRFSKIVRLRGKIITKDGRLPFVAIIPMLIPYLRSIIYRAEQLAEALELRGYQTIHTKPHYGYRLQFQQTDYRLWMLISFISFVLMLIEHYVSL